VDFLLFACQSGAIALFYTSLAASLGLIESELGEWNCLFFQLSQNLVSETVCFSKKEKCLTQRWKIFDLSGMLSSVDWYLVTDVSRQPISSIFMGREVQVSLRPLILDTYIDRASDFGRFISRKFTGSHWLRIFSSQYTQIFGFIFWLRYKTLPLVRWKLFCVYKNIWHLI
jgi:hypothetical protein